MSSLTPESIEELRALCEKATPGPWVRDDWPNPGMQVIAHGNRVVVNHYRHGRQVDAQVVPDMAFIAAFNPETARALIAELESSRTTIAALTDELNGLRHADKMMQADLVAFKTDCSTPTFQLARNALTQIATLQEQVRALEDNRALYAVASAANAFKVAREKRDAAWIAMPDDEPIDDDFLRDMQEADRAVKETAQLVDCRVNECIRLGILPLMTSTKIHGNGILAEEPCVRCKGTGTVTWNKLEGMPCPACVAQPQNCKS